MQGGLVGVRQWTKIFFLLSFLVPCLKQMAKTQYPKTLSAMESWYYLTWTNLLTYQQLILFFITCQLSLKRRLLFKNRISYSFTNSHNSSSWLCLSVKMVRNAEGMKLKTYLSFKGSLPTIKGWFCLFPYYNLNKLKVTKWTQMSWTNSIFRILCLIYFIKKNLSQHGYRQFKVLNILELNKIFYTVNKML